MTGNGANEAGETTAPSSGDLERLVEFELRRLDERRREFGWTPWALLLAMGGAFWQLGERVNQQSDWKSIGLLWAAAIVVWDFLATLGQRSAVKRQSPEPVRYYDLDWLLEGARVAIIYGSLTQATAYLFVLVQVDLAGVMRLFWVPAIAAFVQVPFAFILPRAGLGIRPDMDNSVIGRVSVGFSFVVSLIGAAVGAWIALNIIQAGDRETWRIAVLMVAITKLAGWFAEYRIHAPLQERLVGLRRALAFRELEVREAMRAIDAVLHGSNPEAALWRHVRPFHDSRRFVESSQQAAAELVRKSLENVAQKEADAAERLIAGSEAQIGVAREHLQACEGLLEKVSARMSLLVIQDLKSKARYEEIVANLGASLEPLRKRQPLLEQEHVEAKRAVVALKGPTFE